VMTGGSMKGATPIAVRSRDATRPAPMREAQAAVRPPPRSAQPGLR
jgi:hypothetical protein